ncbi:Imm51 family immunity protein [Dactylosporangium sp. NPDC049525]|uniref:Imm51 family immunity protein n=1 Tax=Dactylosporangium sp. NPDC049525 TaxID=3154730 RepID=UPI003429A8D0
MEPFEVSEIAPGEYQLYLVAGTTDVEDAIAGLGHEPNGPFWEGVVELLIALEAPALEGRFWSDSESDAYLANGDDRDALDELAVLLGAVATDEDRLRQLVELARTHGLELRG